MKILAVVLAAASVAIAGESFAQSRIADSFTIQQGLVPDSVSFFASSNRDALIANRVLNNLSFFPAGFPITTDPLIVTDPPVVIQPVIVSNSVQPVRRQVVRRRIFRNR